jgi:hypothetical protein
MEMGFVMTNGFENVELFQAELGVGSVKVCIK